MVVGGTYFLCYYLLLFPWQQQCTNSIRYVRQVAAVATTYFCFYYLPLLLLPADVSTDCICCYYLLLVLRPPVVATSCCCCYFLLLLLLPAAQQGQAVATACCCCYYLLLLLLPAAVATTCCFFYWLLLLLLLVQVLPAAVANIVADICADRTATSNSNFLLLLKTVSPLLLLQTVALCYFSKNLQL